MDNIIQFGMDASYVPNWGIPEAIREVYQNFRDYGSFDVSEDDYEDGMVMITLRNDYCPNDLSILKIGKSIKSSGSIGKHGEGLKLALLIFLREYRPCTVEINNLDVVPCWVDNKYTGKSFALEINKYTMNENRFGFAVQFVCTQEEWDDFNGVVIDEEDMDCILHTSSYGSIIDKEPGDIYVGGIFVTNLSGFNYAYNFKPEYIELERDRSIPRQYDVEYYASNILETYEEFKKEDLLTDDTNYIDRLPEGVIDEVIVSYRKGVVGYSIDNAPVKPRVAEILLRSPKIQEKIAKLKCRVTLKRNPSSFVIDFNKKYRSRFTSEMKIDYSVIMEKSKKWSFSND